MNDDASLAPPCRFDSSETHFYWMNHSDHRAAKLGDFETVEDYDSAFSPIPTEHAAAMCGIQNDLDDPLGATHRLIDAWLERNKRRCSVAGS